MDTDPRLTYALGLLVLIGVAIVLRSTLCFRKQPTSSSNPEVNQARHDITQARDLLNQLSLQLLSEDKPPPAISPQSTATGATIDPTVLADIFNARLSIFEAQMMTAFTEMEQTKTDKVANSKAEVATTKAELKAALLAHQNALTSTELAAKQRVAQCQIKVDAVEKTLVNQRNTHEQALKTIAASYATALAAVRNETGKSDDAKLAVENYHQILSRKFDDFQQEAVIEKDALKTANANLKIELAQFQTTHADLIALRTQFNAFKSESLKNMTSIKQNHEKEMKDRQQSYQTETDQDTHTMQLEWEKERLNISGELENMTLMRTKEQEKCEQLQQELTTVATAKDQANQDALRSIHGLETEKGTLISHIQQLQRDLKKAEAAAAKPAPMALPQQPVSQPQQHAALPKPSEAAAELKHRRDSHHKAHTPEPQAQARPQHTPRKSFSDVFDEEEKQRKWEKSVQEVVAGMTLAMNQCTATELYQSMHGTETKQSGNTKGTVVQMTAAFAMQLLVDNALPSIDGLSTAVNKAKSIDFSAGAEGNVVADKGRSLYQQAEQMLEELENAIQEAQEKMSGDEAREEARAAAAARGMPPVLRWTAQDRNLVKELW